MIVLRWLRRVLFAVLPAVVVATAVLTGARHFTQSATPSWLSALPLVLLGIVLLLAVLFQQFRVALVVFPAAAVAWRCAVASEVVSPTAVMASVVLPCWFTIVSLQKERRVLSQAGLLSLAGALAVAGLFLVAEREGVRNLMQPLYDARRGSWEEWWQLAPLSVGLVAAGWFTWLVVRRTRTHAMLLLALMFVLLALNAAAPLLGRLATQPLSLCAWAGAGSLLIWTVLEGAWKQAFIDPLTGLPGRRALDQQMVSPGRRYAIAMADIDHFKRINDRYGHDLGDQVLRFIAAQLKSFRHGAAYRYGGEEFAIVLRGNDLKQHAARLDELRRGIAERSFFVRGPDRPRKKPKSVRRDVLGPRQKVKVTVSIGVACRTQERRTPAAVMEAADKALYRAKRNGRDRVCKLD